MKSVNREQLAPVLIGLMGCGKSSIGRRLAAQLNIPLIDLDEYIVNKAGKTIPEIFADDGEEAFRRMECEALRETIGQHAVIATGGGIVMREENRQLLTAHSPVIWLKATPKFLAKRIDGDTNRPLIAGGETKKKLKALAEIRYPFYEKCADFIVSRDKKNKSGSLKAILKYLDRYSLRL